MITYLVEDWDAAAREIKRALRELHLAPGALSETRYHDSKTIEIRYVRKGGLTLDGFGELVHSRGIVAQRPDLNEAAEIMERVFSTRLDNLAVAKAKAERHRVETLKIAAQVTAEAETKVQKRRTTRQRRFHCAECGQIIYAAADSLLNSTCCGMAWVRDTPTVSEILQSVLEAEDAVKF